MPSVAKVSIEIDESSGVARNAKGKRSLDRTLCNLIRVRVDWHGDAQTEVIVMSFLDHGQHRDCFAGYSAVAERDLLIKLCVLPHVSVPQAGDMPQMIRADSNYKEMQLWSNGFHEFAVPVYYFGQSERHSFLLEDKAPCTVAQAFQRAADEGSVLESPHPARILCLLGEVLDLVFDMEADGYTIADAGPPEVSLL